VRVYICVDMEGVGGIVVREQCRKGNPEYEEARYLLIKEANAAVDGAIEAGADDVVVVDFHGSNLNFPLEEMHRAAKFIIGKAPRSIRFPFLDEQTDLVLLVGYHAMSGTSEAIRDHTYNSLTIEKIIINGWELGEVGLDALQCGYYGVPVGLVSGDDKVCKEAKQLLGDVETAVVKFSVANGCAMTYPPKVSREIVRRGAFNAVKNYKKFKPFTMNAPYVVDIKYKDTQIVDGIYVNGRDRIRMDSYTVRYYMESLADLIGKPVY